MRRAGLGAQTLRQANVGLDPGREVHGSELARAFFTFARSAQPCVRPLDAGTKLPTWDVRATLASGGKADARGRGEIYSMAPSFVYSRVATIAA